MRPAADIWRTVSRLIVPPPRMSVSDWLDSHRVIGVGYPSAFPGPWRTSRTPYLKEPLDSFDDPSVETLVLLFSSQIGKTEMLLGSLLYAYGADASPGMYVMPTVKVAEEFSKDRLVRALQTCVTIQVGAQKGRDADNAILNKRVNGFALALAGAESPATLASRPVRRLWADEIDKYPSSTAEGDPLAQAVQRTASFRRRKIALASTPTVKGASRIEEAYEQSDQRKLFAPCPRCGVSFVVEWHHVRWQGDDPSTAHILHDIPEAEVASGTDPGCGGRIEDHERQAMFSVAKWRPTNPIAAKNVRGYRTWAIVSPWLRLSEIVAGFLKARRQPETLQSWINLIRGESWEIQAEKIESLGLLARRQEFEFDVPLGGRILTAGIDTQDDRLEVLVTAWGQGEECWVVSRDSLFGDPAKAEVWSELSAILDRDWSREVGGTARIQCALVDALGHRTANVYSYVVGRQSRRVYASIGKDGGVSGQLVSPPKVLATAQGNVIRHVVDASQVKELIYSRLKMEVKEGPGVFHFPMSVGEGFFDELTAEQLVTKRNKYGVPSKAWMIRPGRKRNESLDCLGMALAALRVVCPTAKKFDALAAAVDAKVAAEDKPKQAPVPRTRNWAG